MHFRNQGFTLIELMIAVAIIAILSAIAVPSYTDYVRRGKLVEAHSMLADFRVKMEVYYQDNRSYANGAACGYSVSNGKSFSVGCVPSNNGQSYIATASNLASKGLGGAGDFEFTVNEKNEQATTKFYGAPPSPAAACWLTKKGATC
ncbi:type IV pilus assembly protein PilE [Chitinivorax tropicus]|uniref:Type IV pilus assembly protein PilE n=1 Tax=Chitinivorax tropicus TaxID=714531 RepID=A0A840MN06_9PROT|nr:prepilin-type N-terminal cleavage/methylation domain-containing protein [Chitinivorax tropicus]MBB5019800.1 type IV pilus assembly protein PilE [Chitinivorax tropicus]